MTEWFEQWFGEEYLRLYPHRDDEDARQAVALVDGAVPLPGLLVLDLACGAGRHAAQLTARGARVVGLDLSMALLLAAKQRLPPPRALVRGDMRALPFRAGVFDLVVNLFTSFGYFSDDSQHQVALAEAAGALKPGGALVLDYFQANAVRAGLVPREERMVGDQRVVIQRSISGDGRFVNKEMQLTGDGRRFSERVRLFSPAELERMITATGLRVRQRFGAYDRRPLGEGAPRAIFVAAHD